MVGKAQFRLFIDESGDHVIRDMAVLAHRCLTVVGCFFSLPDYMKFHIELTKLKLEHFPHFPDYQYVPASSMNAPLILHATDIKNKRGRFMVLQDDAKRQEFDKDILSILTNSEYTIIAVTIDKKTLKIGEHAYGLALAFILERYCGYLEMVGGCGDVMAESRGKKEDKDLATTYENIYSRGTSFRKGSFFRGTLFSASLHQRRKENNISGLQLADLVASPIRQEMISENLRDEEIEISAFNKEIISAVRFKYNRHMYKGRVDGYGKKWFRR